jgi:hypothetical protein
MIPKWQRYLFGLNLLALALSGFGQMPIFKRYYIADIPGMAWTADYWFTHKMHYIGAAVLLFFIGLWAGKYLKKWKDDHSLTFLGTVKIFLYTGIIFTGAMRVAKNLDFWHWGPTTTMLADWLHLFFVVFLGMAGLYGIITKRKSYVRARDETLRTASSAGGAAASQG